MFMAFSKNAYISQIIAYIKNGMDKEAFNFAREFASNYPKEVISNYLLSQTSYTLGKYQESADSARKAFNLSVNREDIRLNAIRTCLAYFQLREYQKGLSMIEQLGGVIEDEKLEQLAFLFSAAMQNTEKSNIHFQKLFLMDARRAEKFLASLLKTK